jgi:hypothetical protein
MLRILALILTLFALPAHAQTVTFDPTTTPIVNPDRGWWEFAAGDFVKVVEADLRDMRQRGLTVGYAVVRLDKFRDKPLSGALLADLDGAFAKARRSGVKVILRFAYNYPQSSQEYQDAQDAPLAIVLNHINQLKPIISANADTITAMQAGFIGAWGEGHSSSNNLGSPANKAQVRDALLKAVPKGVPLQWRYPDDLISWDKVQVRGRFGFHNDCFLSSPTDVGSYSGNTQIREIQRDAMANLTAKTYFSGETCDANKDAIRNDCASILAEGPQFHLSALNRTYYTAFHQRWKSEGCYDTITDKMGYRIRLISARIADGKVTLRIQNEGWAELYTPRSLKLRARGEVSTFGKTLDQINPGETVTMSARLPAGPVPARLCLLAPDPSPRLARDPMFSIRFANATSATQTWKDGAFCFETN